MREYYSIIRDEDIPKEVVVSTLPNDKSIYEGWLSKRKGCNVKLVAAKVQKDVQPQTQTTKTSSAKNDNVVTVSTNSFLNPTSLLNIDQNVLMCQTGYLTLRSSLSSGEKQRFSFARVNATYANLLSPSILFNSSCE